MAVVSSFLGLRVCVAPEKVLVEDYHSQYYDPSAGDDGVFAMTARSLAEVPGAVEDSLLGSEDVLQKFLGTYTEACIVLAVALGVVITFNGRLLLGLAIFALGALPGGYLSFVIALTALEGYQYAWIISLIASVLGAILCGWMCFALLHDLCVFLLGAGLGTIISCFLTAYFLWEIDPKNTNVVFYFTSGECPGRARSDNLG